ncbi:MAG: hypothetical protein ACT4O0_13285 [Pseudonocardia sp.]|jgi:hypothetical protein
METLLYGIALLACPVGMGLMMWMMMRGQKGNTSGGAASRGASGGNGADSDDQVAALRAEIDELKADRTAQRGEGGS